ncbi:hypothetical protein BLOT_009190 [Blomia tropicalis]|nr:hypothetical protein BLOT_009190 [Blomia tropicalis]
MDPVAAFNQSPIKGTFISHFMLVTLALITTDWMPKIFILYNSFFFFTLLWSLGAPQNCESVQLAAIINLLSILLDLISIAINYGRYHYLDWFGFSLFLLIVNLILRGITTIVLFRIYNDRNDRFGSYGLDRSPFTGTGIRDAFTNVRSNQTGYQDLDANSPPSNVTSSRDQVSSATSNVNNFETKNLSYQSVPDTFNVSLIDDK